MTIATPAIATTVQPTSDAVTRSPKRRPTTRSNSAGCNAPITVALATVVCRNAAAHRLAIRGHQRCSHDRRSSAWGLTHVAHSERTCRCREQRESHDGEEDPRTENATAGYIAAVALAGDEDDHVAQQQPA